MAVQGQWQCWHSAAVGKEELFIRFAGPGTLGLGLREELSGSWTAGLALQAEGTAWHGDVTG